MKNARWRVGVLGLDHWYWATGFVPGLLKDPRYELAALWEPQKWRLRATKYPAKQIASDPRQITDDPSIDLVVSFLTCPANAKWLTRAARLGKAVVCDKPIAMTEAAARPLVAALARHRRPSFTLEGGTPLSGRARFLRGLIRKGTIGRPITVTSVMRGGMPQAWWDRSGRGNWGWWVNPKLVPGGAWIDHSIYAISETRYLLGDDPVSVAAVMANVKYPRSVLKLEDYGTATYTYRRGAVVTMEYDWVGGTGSSRLIVGTNGALRWGLGVPDGKVELRRNWKSSLLALPKGKDESLLDHLARALSKGTDTCSPARLGLANLRIALAAYRAAKTGRTVRIGG